MLDVQLINQIDVQMVHVELDKSIVQYSLDVLKIVNHIDVLQEDVQKIKQLVHNSTII